MDRQQAINIRILEIFEEEKIEFAYPTQTVLLQPNVIEKGINRHSLQT
jgi:small-conductance mechanosensitive channel